MNTINLKAEKRTELGRDSRKVRAEGGIPANIFGKGVESQSISVDSSAFKKVFGEAGETGLIEISLGDDKRHVLVTGTQEDPVSGDILHVDFHQVNLNEKVEAQVPVEVEGESPAETSGIGTVVTQLSEIEVSALPMDLPENFTVDISILTEVDQAIFVKDLQYDKTKIEILEDQEAIVAKVEPPQKEEVVEVAPEETEAEGATEGGEAANAPEGEATQETSEE